jgi:hypothetical protein
MPYINNLKKKSYLYYNLLVTDSPKSVKMRSEIVFCMDPTRVVLLKSWDPTSVRPEKYCDPTSVLPKKYWDLTKLNKDLWDPTSKRWYYYICKL